MKRLLLLLVALITIMRCSFAAQADDNILWDYQAQVHVIREGVQKECIRFSIKVDAPLTQDCIQKVYERISSTKLNEYRSNELGYYIMDRTGRSSDATIYVDYLDENDQICTMRTDWDNLYSGNGVYANSYNNFFSYEKGLYQIVELGVYLPSDITYSIESQSAEFTISGSKQNPVIEFLHLTPGQTPTLTFSYKNDAGKLITVTPYNDDSRKNLTAYVPIRLTNVTPVKDVDPEKGFYVTADIETDIPQDLYTFDFYIDEYTSLNGNFIQDNNHLEITRLLPGVRFQLITRLNTAKGPIIQKVNPNSTSYEIFSAPTYEIETLKTATTVTVKNITDSNGNQIPTIYTFSLDSEGGQPITLPHTYTGYRPNSYAYTPLYIWIDGKNCTYYPSYTTNAITVQHAVEEVGPTSVLLKRTSTSFSDAPVKELRWTGDVVIPKDQNSAYITGLTPGKRYEFGSVIVCKDSKGEYEVPCVTAFTTKGQLELTTLQPRNTSSTTAVVRAETNAADVEQNVGFQWRKYDAPASLVSNEGYAAIYEGTMEGYIRNLQPTSYYNVRAFYKDNSDKYYYGEWVTFDPSDFSYFDPTVHTYSVDMISHNSAGVRGYAMPGSEEIEEQGFEYWPTNTQQQSVRRVSAPMAIPQANTVFSTGQVMTATLSDLTADTEYMVRSFVKTATSTYYGEEQSFRTAIYSGVDDIAVDSAETVPVAYYNLTGVRSDVPFAGLNIVLYSDGHTEKAILK